MRILRKAVVVAVMLGGLPLAEARSYVGATTRTVAGNSGFAALSRLCDARFPASRMCTSAEYLASLHPAKSPKGHGPAWIQASPTTWGGTVNGVEGSMDISGVRLGPGYMNCFGWNNAAVNGLTVSGSGQFEEMVCSQVLPVACCK